MLKVESVVGALMNSKIYLISDSCYLDYYFIDIGDFEAAMHLLPKDAIVRGVFITHGHHDHIFGLNRLKASFPDSQVYASEESKRMLASAKANLSYYQEMPFEYTGNVIVLHDNEQVKLFNDITLTAIATPGHHPSCLSFQVGDYFFTGDSYIPNIKVVTNLPGGDKKLAQMSVSKILKLGCGKTICPGHIVL